MTSPLASEDSRAPALPVRRSPFRAALGVLGLGGLLCVAAGTVMWLPREPHWTGSLLGALRPYLGLAAIGATALLLCARRWCMGSAAAGLALWNLFPLLCLYLPQGARTDAGGPELRFVSANLRIGTSDFGVFFDWLERVQPDVVALQEVQASFRAALDERGSEYPHRFFTPEVPDPRNRLEMGVGLLSRFPLLRVDLDHGLWEGRPLIEAEIEVEGTRVVVLAVHVMRPGRSELTAARDRMLRGLAARARELPSVVLLGDLNVSVCQPIFAELLEQGGLIDSSRGFGWQPSWRSTVLVPGLPLDLDHVLTSPELVVLERFLGPDFGSDHRPVFVRLCLPGVLGD